MRKKREIFLCFALGLTLLLSACNSSKTGLPAKGQMLDGEGILSYIPNARVEAGVQQKVALFEDALLLYGSGVGTDGPVFKLATLHMETGEVLYETALSGIETPSVQICGDMVAVADWSDGEIRFLDHKLQLCREEKTGTADCAVYASPDMTKIYCFMKEGGVRVTDSETGENHVLLENTTRLLAAGEGEKTVTVTFVDGTTGQDSYGIVNLDTGEAEKITFPGAAYGPQFEADVQIAESGAEEGAFYLRKAQKMYVLRARAGNSLLSLLSGADRILEMVPEKDGTCQLALYNTDGTFLSQCRMSIAGSGLNCAPVFSEKQNGLFFTVTAVGGRDKLLFWDLEKSVEGESLQLTPQ